MNRRHFLGSLSALTAGMILDPEMALWRPGRTTYFDIAPPTPRRIWVRSDGSDFYDGVRRPKATIGGAMAVARGGDEVLVYQQHVEGVHVFPRDVRGTFWECHIADGTSIRFSDGGSLG